ncbi:hypothetical protein PAMA_003110 [Pampus argenteus]
MDILRTGVFVLFGVLAPVSCSTPFFNDTVICYLLDAVLMVYCITATAFYFREKELERPMDADPYQVLEPSKRKTNHAQKRDVEPFESPPLVPNSSAAHMASQ